MSKSVLYKNTSFDDTTHRHYVEMLPNPFKSGDEVVVPAGARFTTTQPSKSGYEETKRKHTYKVHRAVPSYTSVQFSGYHNDGVVTMTTARIVTVGKGGYWKEITLTEEILEANGQSADLVRVKV